MAALDLVVSRYTEDLKWMSKMPMHLFDRVFIYNKGDDDFEMPCEVKSFEIIKLPNVGKCDHSYIYHIITRYYDLASTTVFLSGVCDQREKWFNALVTVLIATSNQTSAFVTHEIKPNVRDAMFMLHMDSYESKDPRNKEKVNQASMQASTFRPFGLWYANTFGNIDINQVAYFGIFAVAKKEIYNRDIDFYVNIYSMLNKHANPEVGHYIERSWVAIFHPVPPSCMCPLPENKFVMIGEDSTIDQVKALLGSK
jgi:hypothetical protein